MSETISIFLVGTLVGWAMRNMMLAWQRRKEPRLDFPALIQVPLEQGILCLDCDIIYPRERPTCPCGSASGIPVAKFMNRFVRHGVRND